MADRLMDALDAGQSKGGDTRGMQSAGILVVRPLPPNSESTVERIVDIRVDDAENPFDELRRLLQMTQGVPNRLTESAAKLAGDGRFADAIAEQKKALAINPRSEPLHVRPARRSTHAPATSGNALAMLSEVDPAAADDLAGPASRKIRSSPRLRETAEVEAPDDGSGAAATATRRQTPNRRRPRSAGKRRWPRRARSPRSTASGPKS